ncbi:hypothetical protein QFC20_004633 [Naganishia adeliensis]|uniref:Uncharacterized protein n=1 Tax=Naganishia adeliensis TaxID=92952 RepID=A0ACC2VYM2_9TREE|nr:hypothetical protein QFC20_004633 [Naganishia adeliensis]
MADDDEPETPAEVAAVKVQTKALEDNDALLMKSETHLTLFPEAETEESVMLSPTAFQEQEEWRTRRGEDEQLLDDLPEETRRETLRIVGAVEDDDEDEEDDEELKEVGEEDDDAGPLSWTEQEQSTRLNVSRYINERRRKGAISTDKHCSKQIETFTELALAERKIQDDLVDQHFISEFLMYSSKRPKMTTRGIPIPGTRVGSQQLRKLFFGCLRYRKAQVASDPKYDRALDQSRPPVNDTLTKFLRMLMFQATDDLRMQVPYG